MALDVIAHVSLYGLPPHFLAVGPFEAPCCCLFLVPFPEPKSVLGVYLVTAAEPRKAHWERWGEMVNREYHKPRRKNCTRVARIPKSMQPLQHFVVRQRSGTTWSRWFVWMWMHGLPGTTGSVRVSLSRLPPSVGVFHLAVTLAQWGGLKVCRLVRVHEVCKRLP